MAQRQDTRLLGLRGLFVEAQRADDAAAALVIAEEALKIAPASPWACHAVLGFRCASGDWDGALTLVAAQFTSGRIDRAQYHREKGVLLTARALELETLDRDRARELAYEAVKLAPTLVPAAVLAGRFLSEAHQVRRAMRVIEGAWLVQPHPDLADAYAHVRLGDSARQRLTRVETLAAKTPGHIEGALAVARAAIDAGEFGRAREALAPFVDAPTQRVALLMAEIERAENGDTGRARAWTLRAVRAALDPAWTADGYVSDRWRPVSPVSGRIDAFQWQTPVAALPSDAALHLDTDAADDAVPERLAPPPEILAPPATAAAEPPPPQSASTTDHATEAADGPGNGAAAPAPATTAPVEPAPAEAVETGADEPETVAAEAATAPAGAAAPAETAPPPVFRPRTDIRPEGKAQVAPIIPLVRPPDDPGVDETGRNDDYDPLYPPQEQRGGWRGFLARWGA
jgi:HemY protein